MKLERIFALEEVRQHHVKSYTVSIDLRQGAGGGETQTTLKKLSELTTKNKGPARLRIEINYEKSKVALNAADGVELTNELIRAVQVGGLTGRYE